MFVDHCLFTESIGGNKHLITLNFIDDFSRYCAVYFLKSKSDVPEKKEAHVYNDCGLNIGTLQSDNGGRVLVQVI